LKLGRIHLVQKTQPYFFINLFIRLADLLAHFLKQLFVIVSSMLSLAERNSLSLISLPIILDFILVDSETLLEKERDLFDTRSKIIMLIVIVSRFSKKHSSCPVLGSATAHSVFVLSMKAIELTVTINRE